LARSNYIHDIQLRMVGRQQNLEPLVRHAIDGTDRHLTVVSLRSFADQVSLNFNRERLIARLTELFGGLALLLASIGLYGLTAYSVARRTNEIGVRVALGATRREVVSMVLRSALRQIALALLIGVPVSLGASHLLSHELYQVKGGNPFLLGAVMALLTACAVIAAAVPARRAAQVDPIVALRYE
jgi:ABC-type antimicrobial peptide transport system permease subunit